MSGGLRVEVLSPGARDAELDAFFGSCPTSFAQQTPGWREVITGIDRDEPATLVCFRDDELVGVLPGFRFEGPLGSILTSVPQAGPLGGVAVRPGVESSGVYEALLTAYVELARTSGCALATVIGNPFWPDWGLYARYLEPDYVLENRLHVLDLEKGIADFPRASAHLRRNLRRADSAGFEIDDEQTADNVAAWHRVHARRHREIGVPPLPESLFVGALEHMVPRGKGRFFFVRDKAGRLVGGGLYLHHAQVIDALMPSTETEAARAGASYVLARHSILWARDQGLRLYNWQPSPPDGGVYRFKQQWGSREAAYPYFTRVTGDATRLLASTPAEIRGAYPGHYLLPFDRLGAGARAGSSSRGAAWAAMETSR